MGTSSNEVAGDNTSLEKRVAGYRHPHLVVLTPSGTWYTVDRRSGVSLAELQSITSVGPRTTLRLLLDACSGLDAIHHIDGEGGPGPYVHGELGPSSIMAGRDGLGRLIAVPTRRLVGAALHDARGYLAPEKLLGDGTDQRADVFSVGVLLWEAIAGRRLFPDGNVDAVVTQLVGGKVPPLVCAPDATWAAALEPLVQRALAVDPAQRWPNVRALAARVDSLTRGHLASSAQVAAAVALHGGAVSASAPPASSSVASAPPSTGVEPSPSRPAPSARSVSPEADRSRRDAPPPGQIAWEHPGSTMRPPAPATLAAASRGRQAKLVGAALVVSFGIALTSGYLLLFSGAPESTTSETRAVLVTTQVTDPSGAALELVPPTAPALASVSALATAPSATSVPTARPAVPVVTAPPAPPRAASVTTAARPPTVSRPAAASPRPVAPAPSAAPPRPATKPKLDPKDVFGI